MTYPQGPQQGYGGYPQQQPGYPQQQPGYPPQQGYPPQPGGYPGYPPPRKKNTGLIVALAALGAAAVIAVVLVIVLSGKDDSTSTADGPGTSGKPDVNIPGPNGGGKNTGGSKSTGGGSSGGSTGARELAEKAVDIINSHDPSGMTGLTCDSNATRELTQAMSTLPSSATATLGDVREQGSYGQAMIKISMSGKTQTVSLEMAKHGSTWCAAGI